MTIRLAAPADAPAVAAIYRPFCEETAVSFEVAAPDAREMATRIATVTTQYPWLVFEREGGIAGYAYATKHRDRAAYMWSVDTAVYVQAAARRTGVGRALYEKLFTLLAAQGYINACAGIALPNDPSMALHTAVGFTPVGVYHHVGYKLGAWRDVAWLERRLQPPRVAPPPPRPLRSVLHIL
jgi:L-amino acid N-acyltransferase YncA